MAEIQKWENHSCDKSLIIYIQVMNLKKNPKGLFNFLLMEYILTFTKKKLTVTSKFQSAKHLWDCALLGFFTDLHIVW